MLPKTINPRGALDNTRRALAGGKLTVGFLGGSITDARTRYNWPEFLADWLAAEWPGVRLCVENAAIGATGSDLAVFRAERDILRRDCDLVFVEYAVNDLALPHSTAQRCREGLLRKLLSRPELDVVLLYTHSPEFLAALQRGSLPDSIAQFEHLAEHYGIPSVWAGRFAWEQVESGRVYYDKLLPDGLHPQEYGSRVYAEAAAAFLASELLGPPREQQYARDASPVDLQNWERAQLLPWDSVELNGPWRLCASSDLVWADYRMHSHAPGASLRFCFSGTGFAIFQDFGHAAACYDLTVDGDPPTHVCFRQEAWCADHGWIRGYFTEGLDGSRRHEARLTLRHSEEPGRSGANLDLLYIGILP